MLCTTTTKTVISGSVPDNSGRSDIAAAIPPDSGTPESAEALEPRDAEKSGKEVEKQD
jgi:hypothetical protein